MEVDRRQKTEDRKISTQTCELAHMLTDSFDQLPTVHEIVSNNYII
jgi:hypothetical protein